MADSLTLSTLVLSLLLTVFCASTAEGSRSKILLAVLFGCIAIQAGFKYTAFTSDFLIKNRILLIIPEVSSIITPPIIYLFVLSLLNQQVSTSLLLKMAVLPVIAIIMFFVFYGLTEGFTVDAYYVLENFIILFIITLGSYVLYVILAYRKIAYSFGPQQVEVSNHTRIVLFWVKLLLALMLFRASLGLIYYIIQLLAGNSYWFEWFTPIYKILVPIILLIATALTAYYALRNPDLFESITEKKTLEQSLAMAILPNSEKKAIKKGIDESEVASYIHRIESVMREEKLYLNSNLNAAFLAEKAGLPVYKITYSLNKGLGKNLNEYVNGYRVEHAKGLLADPKNARLTIYSIALDSGFASEAPFYAAFKKNVGQSPSAFRSAVSGL